MDLFRENQLNRERLSVVLDTIFRKSYPARAFSKPKAGIEEERGPSNVWQNVVDGYGFARADVGLGL